MILMEQRRDPRNRDHVPLDRASELPAVQQEQEQALSECFRTCLAKLPAGQKSLIIEYYQKDKIAKIAARKDLAERLNMPLNALRIRACRIRAALEECVRGCTETS